MVAYNFRAQFVPQIQFGLGELPLPAWDDRPPKLHTIRSHRTGRCRHARPGEGVQLYCGLRTKKSFLIGTARCIAVQPIFIHIVAGSILAAGEWIVDVNRFAREDGFMSWDEMRRFWQDTYGQPTFEGVIIRWTPLEDSDEQRTRGIRTDQAALASEA